MDIIPKKVNNLDKILASAEKLFFSHDYDSVSMSDIAKSVNITKAALYYHFKSKSDLYLTVIKRGQESYQAEVKELFSSSNFKNKPLEEKIEELLKIYFGFISKKKEILKILLKKIDIDDKKIISFLDESRAKMIETIDPLSQAILDQKKPNNNLSSKDVSMLFLSMLNPFAYEYFKARNDNSPTLIAKKITSFILN